MWISSKMSTCPIKSPFAGWNESSTSNALIMPNCTATKANNLHSAILSLYEFRVVFDAVHRVGGMLLLLKDRELKGSESLLC